MRYHFVLLAVLFLFGFRDGYGQVTVGSWRLLPDAPTPEEAGEARHDDIVFVSPSTGWIVNLGGQIWKTVDGGDTWTKQFDTEGSIRFRSVGFGNEQVGWAGTVFSPSDVLYETRDGGLTWTNITSRIVGSLPSGICGLWAASEQVAYGVGAFFGEPRVIKTRNGGLNWGTTNLSVLAATLIDVYFFNENVGIIVGGTGANFDGEAVILRTTNGGITWGRVYTSTREDGISGEWGWKLSFPTPEVGYVSVEYHSNPKGVPAKVLKTTDSGATWAALSVTGNTDGAGLQGVGFVTEDIGWVSGRGTSSITLDGGATWQRLIPYSEQDPEGQLDGLMNRAFVLNDTLAYAVGGGRYINTPRTRYPRAWPKRL